MNHTRMASVALTVVLGAALAASIDAQQDSSGVNPHVMARTQQAAPRALRPRSDDPARAEGPKLGVMVQQTPDGLLVTEVLTGSLAETLGVRPQDILLRIDDERIESVVDVQRALSATTPGATVSAAVIREGEGIVLLSGEMPAPAPSTAPAPMDRRPRYMPDDPQTELPPGVLAPEGVDGFRGGFLGVQLATEADTDASTPDADHEADAEATADVAGVLIVAVIPETAAWFAGLQPGDRLLSIDGKPLTTSQDLLGAVSGKEPGAMVELAWQRNGEERATTVRLGERQAGGALGDLLPRLRMLPFDPQRGGPGGGAPNFPRPRTGQPGNQQFFGDVPPHDGMFPMQDLHQQIQQFLQDMDLDAMDAQRQTMRVDIRNGHGTLSVTRDGKTEVYTLDDQGHWNKSSTPDTGAPDTGATDTAAPDVAH